MHILADFLNHGTLPFIGRETETALILDFWRGTFQATGLRAMLLAGEAGIGKSRLLEHAMGRVVAAGGSVVHVKLYPESTASFMSLVARALRHPDAGRAILAEELQPKLGAVGDAMRRLARLRPTLFVLEDLHLLATEAMPELVRLLKLLGDETISLLALARPVELDARGALEPYLVADLMLPGLASEECAKIWEQVSGTASGPEVAAALYEATLGNPLALRSALRGALRPGGAVSGGGGAVGSAGHALWLARSLKRTVGLLAEGMTAHLTGDELKAARHLAVLGEVFAREAADIMIDDAGAAIDALLFKGIISTVTAAPDPLPGAASMRAPLGFTHTLLHRHLIGDSVPDADHLVRVLADAPLYSIVPYQLPPVRGYAARTLDGATIIRAFDRTIKVQMALVRGPLWRNGEQTCRVAIALAESRIGSWERAQWERMLVKLIYHKLSLVRRAPMEIQSGWLNYLSSVTASASSDELVTGRLYALSNRTLRYSTGNPDLMREVWEEAEALINARPHLRFTFAYTDYVGAACIAACNNEDTAMKRRIEERAGEILISPDLPAPVRATFERKVRPPLLSLFESEDELRIRLARIAEFERTVERGDTSVWVFCIDLLAEVGAAGTLERICDNTIPLIREQNMAELLAYVVARRLRVRAGAGEPFVDILPAFGAVMEDVPQRLRMQVGSTLVPLLIEAALLRNEPDAARALAGRYGVTATRLPAAHWMGMALDVSDPIAALKDGRENGGLEDDLADLLDLLINGDAAAGFSAIDSTIGRAIGAPPLRLNDILRTSIVARMLALARDRGSDIPASLATAVADAIARALEWLAAPERGLFAHMRSLLEHGAGYLSERRMGMWRKKIDELAAVHGRRQDPLENGRLKLSMLGTIAVQTPDGARQRFQGARARMLLGTMVVNTMLKEPLSMAEFCRLAAGDDSVEIENARDIVKTTVHRLREVMGRDAILTSGQTPRLNLELVEIDLQEAHHLLKRASEAMRRSSPMQAKAALMAAFAITRGEVPFPSLYDNFIEAVREDFENELRATALDVARALAGEGGMDDAADVLRAAGEAIPGDGELAEELRDTLLRAGRRAEAERVRMKVEVE